MTPRTEQLRSRLYRRPPEICLERARIFTESWYELEGEPLPVRRALALARVLGEVTVFIEEGELIVGNHAARPLAAPLFPEYSVSWWREESAAFAARPQDAFILREEDRAEFEELAERWRGKTHFDRVMGTFERSLPPDVAAAFDRDGLHVNQAYHTVVSTVDGDGHVAPDYGRVLRLGFEGLARLATKNLNDLDPTRPENLSKRLFLGAAVIACEAAAAFGRRYAALARRLAAECTDEKRREELEEIAAVCERVPAGPASTFREALQTAWFVFLLTQIESNGHSISLGRFDQYLRPYYERDLAAGRIEGPFDWSLEDERLYFTATGEPGPGHLWSIATGERDLFCVPRR